MPPLPYLENVPGKPGRYRVRKEPLLSELYRYLYQDDICGWSIRHKFVVQLGADYPDRCADVNHTYRMVKERVDACEKKLGDGTEYVFSHCRGYRFDTLVRIAKRLSPADYWRLVSRVWTDSEKTLVGTSSAGNDFGGRQSRRNTTPWTKKSVPSSRACRHRSMCGVC